MHGLDIDAGTLFVAGGFDSISSEARGRGAAYDVATDNLLPWDPNVSGRLLWIDAAGPEVYLGGTIYGVWGLPRSNVAVVDRTSAAPFAWSPTLTGDVYNFAVLLGRVVVGGEFTGTNGDLSRKYLAEFDRAAGPTAALASLVSGEAVDGRIQLRWLVPSATRVEIERNAQDAGWVSVGVRLPDGAGFVDYEDRDVVAGTPYAYRLRFSLGGREVVAGQTTMQLDDRLEFAFAGARPNPSDDGLTIAFTRPDRAPSDVQVVDVTGRIRLARDLSQLAPGRHVLQLDGARALRAGAYFIRLRHGSRVLSVRAIVLH